MPKRTGFIEKITMNEKVYIVVGAHYDAAYISQNEKIYTDFIEAQDEALRLCKGQAKTYHVIEFSSRGRYERANPPIQWVDKDKWTHKVE